MDSSSLSVIIEALTKLFNPKLEKERAENQLKQDIEALEALFALGFRPEFIEYVDGRLHFKMILSENADTQSVDVISLGDLKNLSLSNALPDGDDGKLKLEPPQKKYE